MKNFHLDLVRVTEAGAISAAEWVGRGDKESADKAATTAMRDRLNKIDFSAEIAIGEGKKDNSHGLYDGETVGAGWELDPSTPEQCIFGNVLYDIAIDPIEGTTPTAKGGYEAMSVIALANKDCFYKTERFYMMKLAVGPKVAKRVNLQLDMGMGEVVCHVADALGKSLEHVTVCVLDRPRSQPLVEALRVLGCRIKFISDCDVTACIATCVEDSGIDMYWSVGGSPEAVIAAAAMKCMGGYLLCQEVDNDFKRIGKPLTMEDLAKGPTMVAATGITDGSLLEGVRFTARGPITNSIAMRSDSGTIRRIKTEHGN